MAAMAFQWSLAALETLMAEEQMDQHATVLRAFSVVELWRLRRVCRAFHRWGTAALAALPRPAAVGGDETGGGGEQLAGVEVLDLSTLRFGTQVPALPKPRSASAVCCFGDGRLVVIGGDSGSEDDDKLPKTALQWARGAPGWTPLPDMAGVRQESVAVALPDGRAMVIGGRVNDDDGDYGLAIASVEVLAADGSGWSALAAMGTARASSAAAVLPCGKVLVAGGSGFVTNGADEDEYHDETLKTAELWDPATGEWSELPPMARPQSDAACCLLPSGRVAVLGGGGWTADSTSEAFDPETQTWLPLANMHHSRSWFAAVPVAGGLVAIGGTSDAPNELYDEESERWFELPHPMAEHRRYAGATSLPPAAATS
eukprot:COSAG04_NODE_24_length_37684_cov_50.391060_5_plen_372_part_00